MIIGSPADFYPAARARLPRFLFDYADGGATSETTMAANIADLNQIRLRQRVLHDVSDISLSTNLLGQDLALPIILGPVGISGMYRRRGETQAARAAHARGLPFTLSTVSLCSLQEVRAASNGALWFQLYVIRDRAFMLDLLATARECGVSTLVFTVDMPVPGSRYRDMHSGMSGPNAPIKRVLQAMTHPKWAWDVGLWGRPHRLGNLTPVLGKDSGLNDYMGWLGDNFDPSITWADLGWIRDNWHGKLVIKGILDPEDAREAANMQADAIVVSNHGGRQLDGVLSTARALPAMADAVADRLTILVDGGVRSGLDVVRMLALGADGVMLGRAWLWALAAQGEQGVVRLLDMMAQEMRTAMALTGVTDMDHLDRSILATPIG